MFEDDFLETMVDQIVWEKHLGYDEDGQTIWASPKTLQCRISPKQRLIQDARGADVVATANVYPAGAPAIDAADRIRLPSGKYADILRVEIPPDTDGSHHTKVII